MSEEIKVVIALRENRGSIGVQSPDCDPLFMTFEGNLGLALEKVPGLVAKANQKWEANPQYPKCEAPLPSQTQPAQRLMSRQAASTAQPQMF